jgi:hypothetical protein
LVTIRHSGAANSVGSLSPRAATRVPQTRARVGEGWGEGRFCRVRSCRPHPLTPPLGSIWTERAVSGVYSTANLVDVQDSKGVYLFWQHRLADLATFVKRAR